MFRKISVLVIVLSVISSPCHAIDDYYRDCILMASTIPLMYIPVYVDGLKSGRIKLTDHNSMIIRSDIPIEHPNLIASSLIVSGLIWSYYAKKDKSIASGIISSLCLGYGVTLYAKDYVDSPLKVSCGIGLGMIGVSLIR